MYKWAVFVSYKWEGEYAEWVNEIFYPIIKNYFISKFGKNYAFKDKEQLPEGMDVQETLRMALIQSKCLIAVVNGPYFCHSEWCPVEFSVINHRQEKLQFVQTSGGKLLVFPVVFTRMNAETGKDENNLHNVCPLVASKVDKMNPLKIEENTYLRVGSVFKASNDYYTLRNRIWEWLERSIIPSIKEAPPWVDEWQLTTWIDEPAKAFKQQIDCQPFYSQPLL